MLFTAIQGLLGFLLLIAGSQLYWLFIAGMLFVAAGLLPVLFPDFYSGDNLLLYASVTAAIGVILSVPLKRVMVALAGLLAGVYLAVSIPDIFGFASLSYSWFILLITGIAGAALVTLSFGVGLIVLSSMTGAALLAQSVSLDFTSPLTIFISAWVIGLAAQIILAQYAHPTPEPA